MSYCSDCAGALCQFCLQAHRRIKMYQAHAIIPLGKANVSLTTFVKHDTRLTCNSHPQEDLNIYCKSCCTLVCCECLVAHHQKHELATVNDEIRQEVQEEVFQLLKTSTTKQQEMVTAKEYIESVEAFIIERSERLKGTIKSTYQNVFELLEKKQKEHLEKAEAMCNSNLKTIWADKDYVQQTYTSLQSAITFAERNLKCSNMEFLRMSTQLLSRLKELNGIQWSESHLERLVFTGSQFTSTTCGLNIGEIEMYTQGVDSDVGLHIESIPSELPLGKMKTFNITLSQSHPVSFRLPSLSAVITYGATKKDLPHTCISVSMKKWGLWEVAFTPICGGEHELYIFIAGQKSSTLKQTFKVIGRPWTNACVSKGPDYREPQSVAKQSQSSGKAPESVPVRAAVHCHKSITGSGRVRNSYYPFGHYRSMILVEWDIGGSSAHRWGNDNSYDVQLVI